MDKSRLDLAVYRLEKSAECIETAKSDLENGFYSASVNRSYYAIFHSARAIMALDGEDRKRHTGVISYFQEHYIKTKIFDIELSDIIQDAFNMRQISDYMDFFVVSLQDVKEQLEGAEIFYKAVSEYITDKTKNER